MPHIVAKQYDRSVSEFSMKAHIQKDDIYAPTFGRNASSSSNSVIMDGDASE